MKTTLKLSNLTNLKPNFKSCKQVFLMAGLCLGLSACNLPNNDSTNNAPTNDDSTNDENTATEQSKVSEATPEQLRQLQEIEQTIMSNTGIRYNSQLWAFGEVADEDKIKLNDLSAIKYELGGVKSTDGNVLDYLSDHASLYRFMDDDQPYLDVIESDNLLEIDWYFALPSNTDNERLSSVAHAKKVYDLARLLMGADGGELIKEILAGQEVAKQTIGGHKVHIAKCELNRCMLVMEKTNNG